MKAPLESETEESRSKVKETDIQEGAVLPSEENDDDLSLAQHPSLISLSNVSFCVPILGSKNVTCFV